jgi:hypothetical protein
LSEILEGTRRFLFRVYQASSTRQSSIILGFGCSRVAGVLSVCFVNREPINRPTNHLPNTVLVASLFLFGTRSFSRKRKGGTYICRFQPLLCPVNIIDTKRDEAENNQPAPTQTIVANISFKSRSAAIVITYSHSYFHFISFHFNSIASRSWKDHSKRTTVPSQQ